MRNVYLLFLSCLVMTSIIAQNETTSSAIIGSCIIPDSNLVMLYIDYTKNCPEADPGGLLAGAKELGFHSGINDWEVIVRFDSEDALTVKNLGNDVFMLKLNTDDYYGVPISSISRIDFMLPNLHLEDPWANSCKDDRDDGGVGGPISCSNFAFIIETAPYCSEQLQQSSHSLFGPTTSANTCLDTTTNELNIAFDLSLNCPKADPLGVLASVPALGFQSGPNRFSSTVHWDDIKAKTAINNGSDVFTLTINPETYYGCQ